MKEVFVSIDQQATTVLRVYRTSKGVGLTKETPIFNQDEKTIVTLSVDEARLLIGALQDELREEACGHCGQVLEDREG